MLQYLIENGAAHQFVDRKVIQGNFAESYNPFRKFSLPIHTSMREFFHIKRYPNLRHIPILLIMEVSPPPPPPQGKVKYITYKSNRFTNISTSYISSLVIIDNTSQDFLHSQNKYFRAILASMLMNEIGLQFLIILLSLSFFSVKIITDCR